MRPRVNKIVKKAIYAYFKAKNKDGSFSSSEIKRDVCDYVINACNDSGYGCTILPGLIYIKLPDDYTVIFNKENRYRGYFAGPSVENPMSKFLNRKRK